MDGEALWCLRHGQIAPVSILQSPYLYPILPTDPCQVSGTLTDDTRSVADQLGVQLAGLSQELQRLSAAKADKVIVCQVEMLKLALILKSL